ncbi:MAG TPA: hypothetical protein VHX44_13700 [Planctomycetota bacterium]|nr:hypothetical protein [Planctomycetota bacterium]
MTFDPLIPLWVTLGLAGAAVIAALRSHPTWSATLVLRLGLIALVTMMLGNPVREIEQPVTRKPSLLLVADSSGSMATADGPGNSARFTQARVVCAQLAAELGDLYQITQVGFAHQLHAPMPDQTTGDTDFTGLTALVAQAPKPAAVVFVSDGADWRHSDPDGELARARITVHTLGVGDQRPTTNLALRLEVASPTVFPGQELPMTVTIAASPDLRGRRVKLEVDTISDVGRNIPLSRQEVTLDAMVRVPLVDTPSGQKSGRLWRARIAPLPGELTEDDNQDFASAQVVDKSVRVLVFEGQPYWDTTYAVRAWRRDRQLDVATAFGVGKRTWRAGNAAPDHLDAAALKGVDVVVLGQALDRLGSNGDTARILHEFVDHGGGVVLLGPGKRLGGALEELDPIDARGALKMVEITSADASIPGLLPNNTRLAVRTAQNGSLKPQARVLLGSRDQPLIASRHIGGGWVCSVNMEGVWGWNISGQGREVGERFWRQVLRTLTNAPMGSLRAERMRVAVGEELVVWLQPDAAHQPVRLVHSDGKVQELAVADDTVRARLERSGLYRIECGNDRLTVVATLEVREQLEIARDDARLMRLAAATGGEFCDAADTGRLVRRLRTARMLAGTVQRPESLITDSSWFVVALVLAGLEWWLRRRRGLV